jgi:S-layer homology domain
MKTRRGYVLLVAGGLFCAGVLEASSRPRLNPRASVVVGSQTVSAGPGFGTQDLEADLISFLSFFPVTSTSYSSSAVSGTRWETEGTDLAAPVALPNGALLESLSVYYYDANAAPSAELTLSFCRHWRHADTGASPDSDCVATFTASGAPGYAVAELPVPAEFQSFLRRADVDDDGTVDSVDYSLYVFTYPDTAIASVRANWRRQVSPAPATATFNDVPTGHPQFPFIEALAASGITAGCGAGNYCPDASLTRGQMAVFLAKALGLHWSP